MHRLFPKEIQEPFVFLLGQGRGHPLGHVQPGQGPHPVDPGIRARPKPLPTEIRKVRELHVGPGLASLRDLSQSFRTRKPEELRPLRRDHPHQPVVEVGGEVFVHKAHVVGGKPGFLGKEEGLELRLGEDLLVEDGDHRFAELHHALGGGEDDPSILGAQGLGHPAGEGEHGVDGLPADELQDLLGLGPHLHHLPPQIRKALDHAEDVPLGFFRVREEEVRPAQENEVQKVVGEDVGVVKKLALEPRGLGDLRLEGRVQGLGRGQMMGLRADPADALRDLGHFLGPAAPAKGLKAPQLRNLQDRVPQLPLLVEVDQDLPVALKAGDGVDDDLFHARTSWRLRASLRRGRPYLAKEYL